MKTKITLSLALIAILFITSTMLFNHNMLMSNSSGAVSGKAGDPAGGFATCTDCHSGAAATPQNGWITANIPVAGYTPGTSYTITATAVSIGTTRFGFEISPQNASGTFLGTMALLTPTTTQLVGSNHYITHTSSGTTGTTGFHTWQFRWTAPASGSGPVTFYGAFNATNSNGGSSGDVIYTSQLTVSQELPPLVLSTTHTNVSCNGQCDGAASVNVNGGSAPYAILWSNNQFFPDISNLCADTYTVVVTDMMGSTATTTVTITEPAAVVPTINIFTADLTVCSGVSVIFQQNNTNAGSNPSYQWKVDGNTVGTNPTFTTNSLSNGQVVTCQLTSNATCANPATVTSNSIQMTIIPTATVTATLSVDDAIICDGQTASFTLTGNNFGANPFIEWLVNGSTETTSGLTYSSSTLSNGDEVTVGVSSSETCPSEATIISNTIVMNVSAYGTPAVSISTPNLSVCSGISTTFTANASSAGNNPTYNWMVNGNSVQSGTAATFSSAAFNTADEVSCLVTSSALCNTINTVLSNSVTLSIQTQPTLTITPNQTVCSGTAVLLEATPSIAGGTYMWMPTMDITPSINYNLSTSVTFTVDYHLGSCTTSGIVTVDVINIPTPIVSANGLQLSSSAATGNQWYLDGNIIPSATNQTYDVTQNGVYTVIVSDGICDSQLSNAINITNVGFDALNLANSISIYPNPFNQFAVLKLTNPIASGTVAIIDVIGNLVWTKRIHATTSEITINKGDLQPGIYYLQVSFNAQTITKKLVVQ
jgi:Secretion system C-terminal sorting domain/SprB repeat